MRRILIRGARQLLTMRGSGGPRRGPAHRQLGIIEDGSILIENGRILEVGSTRRLENLRIARGADEIDAEGRVVMPGFVDCHSHLVAGAPRVFGQTGGPRLRSQAVETLRRCATHGTTTMAALTGEGLNEALARKSLRVCSLIEPPVRLVPSASVTRDLLAVVARRKLAGFAHTACGPGHYSVEECQDFLDTAFDHGLRARIDFAAEGRTEPLIPLLEGLPRTVDHLEFGTPADLEALAGSAAVGVLLPAASFHLGRPYACARALADSGGAIALGSDYHPVTLRGYSMQFVVYLACRKLHLSVDEALLAATINAAFAVGLEQETGSLQPGKRADLLLLQTGDYRALGSEFGINLVEMTMCGGEIVHDAAGKR
jgi:imidazolonepropionase